MKFISTLFGLTLLFSVAQAQNKTAGKNRTTKTQIAGQSLLASQRTQAVNDTLGASILQGCDLGPFLLDTDLGGFLAGTNGYEDLEKAQFLSTNTSGSIHSILVAFGEKITVGTPDNFTAKIYTGNSTSGPQSQIGVNSAAVNTNNIDTAGNFTRFSFATPISYNGGFFASIVVGGASLNDTIGILHTDDDCGGNGAWELWSENTWNSFNDGWEIDPALYVFAEVDAALSLDNNRLIDRGSHKVFPNPGKGQTTLTYSLLRSGSVEISLNDLAGKTVSNHTLGFQNQGLNAFNFNTSNLPNGIYLYTIKSGNQRLTGKFVVSK